MAARKTGLGERIEKPLAEFIATFRPVKKKEFSPLFQRTFIALAI